MSGIPFHLAAPSDSDSDSESCSSSRPERSDSSLAPDRKKPRRSGGSKSRGSGGSGKKPSSSAASSRADPDRPTFSDALNSLASGFTVSGGEVKLSTEVSPKRRGEDDGGGGDDHDHDHDDVWPFQSLVITPKASPPSATTVACSQGEIEVNGRPLAAGAAALALSEISRVTFGGLGSAAKITGRCNVATFEEDARALTMPRSWAEAIGGWEKGIVAVVGGRNVGKSTLVKAAAVSSQGGGSVMDLDPGRPIDGAEGTIKFKGRRIFYGGAAVKDDPRRWLEGVEKLKGLVEGDEKVIVNMPGWVKGMGLEATKQCLKVLQADIWCVGQVDVEGLSLDVPKRAREKAQKRHRRREDGRIFRVKIERVKCHNEPEEGMRAGLEDADGWCVGCGVLEKLAHGYAYIRVEGDTSEVKRATAVRRGKGGGYEVEDWGAGGVGGGGMKSWNGRK